jgi:Cu2+-exporting ATPase
VFGGRRLRLGSAAFALGACRAPDCSTGVLEDAIVLADDEGAIAALHLSERLRPGAREAVEALARAGLALEIVSGDARRKVADVAARVGIARFSARALPADKLARLAELRKGGARVIAVGDGLNDAPVLAGADVAVALASGTAIAQASSDIVLAGERLGALARARAIARETLAILRQNQRWALGYNLAAVPLAALGFVPPWLAALGMSVSSLVVVLNALRIGRGGMRADAHATRAAPAAAPA